MHGKSNKFYVLFFVLTLNLLVVSDAAGRWAFIVEEKKVPLFGNGVTVKVQA